MSNRNLFFLVNGNKKIGFGHINRCLMLADESKKLNVNSIFLNSESDGKIYQLIKKRGFEVIKVDSNKEILNVLSGNSHTFLIIDSDDPIFREISFQQKLLDLSVIFMYFTINNEDMFLSNYILNPNIIAESLTYKTAEYTKKLLGPNYFILNEEARNIQPKPSIAEKEKYKVLISFGSADPLDITSNIIQAIDVVAKEIEKVYVIVGGLNQNLAQIESLGRSSQIPIEVIYNTREMYSYMKKVDLAFTSMGMTFWELSLHNIPCIALSGSQREEKVLDYIAGKRFCLTLGHGKNFDIVEGTKKLKAIFNTKEFLTLETKALRNTINLEGISLILKTLFHEA